MSDIIVPRGAGPQTGTEDGSRKPAEIRFERFLDMARQFRCDGSGRAFEQAIELLAPPRRNQGSSGEASSPANRAGGRPTASN